MWFVGRMWWLVLGMLIGVLAEERVTFRMYSDAISGWEECTVIANGYLETYEEFRFDLMRRDELIWVGNGQDPRTMTSSVRD